jgi:alpha-galactosidase
MIHRLVSFVPVTAYFRDVGVADTASVRDLWEKRDLGVFKSSFRAQVPSHGVVMIKVK